MKLRFNPIVPLLRVSGVIFYVGFVYFSLNLWYDHRENITDNPVTLLLIAFYLLIFYTVIVSVLKGLMTEIQFVRLESENLKITNPIKSKDYEIPIKDIECVYKSQKRYGRGYVDSLEIRTKSNLVFELPKHHYFNFNNFIDALKKTNLPYKTSAKSIIECESRGGKFK